MATVNLCVFACRAGALRLPWLSAALGGIGAALVERFRPGGAFSDVIGFSAGANMCAESIVTANLRDFPESALAPLGLVAEHPDAFLSRVMNESKELALSAFFELCANRKNPRQSPHEVLEIRKRQGLSATAAALQEYLGTQ